MKKTLTILSIILLGAIGCTKNVFETPAREGGESDGMVEVSMTLDIPVEMIAATKAGEMSHLPSIDDIRVAMFGTSGYTQAYTKAEPDGPVATTNYDKSPDEDETLGESTTKYKFKVLLPVYEGEVHIHVIANGDKSVIYDGWPENKLMSRMTTTGGIGAYWARIVIEDGILPQWSSNGTMVVENGHFKPTEGTADAFKDIALIRNFAEVKLILESAVTAKLSDVSYTVVNVPTSGSVAPIFGNSPEMHPISATDTVTVYEASYLDDFVDFDYDPATALMKNAKTSKVYDGYMVSKSVNSILPDKTTISTALPDDGVALPNSVTKPAFVYERMLPTSNPPMILMRGKWTDGKYYYYRLDMMDENLTNTGGYFPLYRNYQYQVRIAKIGNKGATTIAEAMTRNSGGNISMTMDTRSLKDISDGTSQLKVAYTDHTYITGGQKNDFYVEYQAVSGSSTPVEGATVQIYFKKDANGNPIKGTAITSDIEVDRTVDGKTYYKFTLADRGDVTKESTFVVEANNGKSGDDASKLIREITVRVLKNMDMVPSFNPKKAASSKGSKVTLNIALPDTLMESMFPLEFHIQDNQHILTPTGKNRSGTGAKNVEVPAKVEKSMFDGSASFSYIRTINWTEYNPMREAFKNGDHDAIVFQTEFETLEDSKETQVKISNEYFNDAQVKLEREPRTLKTGTATFSYSDFGTNKLSATTADGHVTLTFSNIYSTENNYIQLANDDTPQTLTVTTDNTDNEITKVSLDFSDYNHSRGNQGITANVSAVTKALENAPYTRTWPYNGITTSNNLVLTFTRGLIENNPIYHQVTAITVEYQYYE